MAHGVPAQRSYLFVDYRWILCSDLIWRAPDGSVPPLRPASGPALPVTAEPGLLPYGFRLVTQPALEHRPITNAGPCWRSRIIRDGGVYRGWGIRVLDEAQPLGARIELICTESNDGLDWRTVATSTFVSPGGPHADGFTVFIDPGAPTGERYKAVVCIPPPQEQFPALFQEYLRVQRHNRIPRFSEKWVMAMYGLTSPDGLNWTLIPQHQMVHYSDTDTSVYYDAWLKQYVMYTRLKYQERRWIGRSVSDDFRTWGSIDPIVAPPLEGPPSTDVYQNGYTAYPGEDAYQLMFPMFYHRWNQTSDIRLYSSEDGLCWQRVPGEPMISPSTCRRAGTQFLGVGKDLLTMGQDQIALPYFSTPYPHKYPRWPGVLEAVEHAWALWPKGRLAALTVADVGEFHTFPIEPMGRSLCLNARIARGGSIRVGLVGIPGRSAADCAPLAGDSLAHQVTWSGDDHSRAAPGAPVTLHFQLRSAELFGYEWV